ncbi:hypothetical protein CYLTODRAFT_494979 [Cylindrobasidium torrendii FP15055 ss-10]|uniref:Uncharacterized protein n=1 Tax=Cylindrobasidium torrendii FP15055 ss-10 TaxID=1314674 RepID=A0A0D7AV81_9AGAR|nr:hypothetical protein CYLTODRAFT_494979 [Cylindrobasidium torrendii FP15055 ss-10]
MHAMDDTPCQSLCITPIFDGIPIDIVYSISIIAAITSPSVAATLLRVSRLLHSWIKPILYRRICIVEKGSDAAGRLIPRGLRELDPAAHTRILQTTRLIETCSVYAFKWSPDKRDLCENTMYTEFAPFFLSLLKDCPNLRRMSIVLPCRWIQSERGNRLRTELAALPPNLTHLSFLVHGTEFGDAESDLRRVLSRVHENDTLRVCVVRFTNEDYWNGRPADWLMQGLTDMRIVLVCSYAANGSAGVARLITLSNTMNSRHFNTATQERLLVDEDEMWEVAECVVQERYNNANKSSLS